MVADGALDHYPYLFLSEGGYFDSNTLQQIDDWLRKGGILISLRSNRVLTVSGDDRFQKEWFADVPGVRPLGSGRTVVLDASWENRAELFVKLAKFFQDEGKPLPDGLEDGVFVTELKNGWYLYNSTDQPLSKDFFAGQHQIKKKIPAHTIVLHR